MFAASPKLGTDGKRQKFNELKQNKPIAFNIFLLLFKWFESNLFKLAKQDGTALELDAKRVFDVLLALADVDTSAGCWHSRALPLVAGRPAIRVLDRL